MEIGRRKFMGMAGGFAGLSLATFTPRPTLARQAPGVKLASASDPGSMELWWVSLEKNEPESSRALLKMAARPGEAVAFLKGKLKPVILDPELLNELLNKLGSADEGEWKPAFEELEYFDPRVAMPLEDLMKLVVDAPMRQRLVAVLSGRTAASMEGKKIELRKFGNDAVQYNFIMIPGGSWWAEEDLARLNTRGNDQKVKWTRTVRAISLLEHIGTSEAIAILKDLTTGQPSVQPTRMAVEAIERIEANKAR